MGGGLVGGVPADASQWPIAVGDAGGWRLVPVLLATGGPLLGFEVGIGKERGAFFTRTLAVVLSSGQAVVEEEVIQLVGEVELGGGVEDGRCL